MKSTLEEAMEKIFKATDLTDAEKQAIQVLLNQIHSDTATQVVRAQLRKHVEDYHEDKSTS